MANYSENGVKFTVGDVGIFTSGMKIARGKYNKDSYENILGPQKIINAIDIDWNNAEVEGLSSNINSTAQLLKLIGELYSKVNKNSITISENGTWVINGVDLGVKAIGVDGKDGATNSITIGENGNWFINNVDTGVKAIAINGQDGATNSITIGENGNWFINGVDTGIVAQGASGIMPALTIGENGNWFINNVDTGVKAIAINGNDGTSTNITIGENGNWFINGIDTGKPATSQSDYTGPNIIILSLEEYEALDKYADNTLYFVTGDYTPSGGDEPGGGDEPTDIFSNISTNLTVSYFNGEEFIETVYTEDGEISLYPQRKYNISGTLKGYIKINTAGHNIVDDTELVLNNVKILSEDVNYGIIYQTPDNAKKQKALKITLARNSENYIYCSQVVAIAESQPGAIYSTNNMIIQGAGYLSVKNNGGHGLKADEFELGGPNIWIDASHDGIHAKDLYIIGGIYFINRANDAIGTNKNNKGECGHTYLFDGTIVTNDNNILGCIIDSQSPGIYFSDNLLSAAQLENCVGMHLLNSSDYTSGHIYWYDEKPDDEFNGEGGEIPLGEDNKYHITHPYILIIGYLNNPLIFELDNFGRVKNDDATIYLSNAYIETNSNTPVFYYEAESEKIKIISVNDTINVIKNIYNEQLTQFEALGYESDCIKSESNLTLEVKDGSNLYISSIMADGLDGGDVKINDSKGNLIITNCGQRGIKGNAVVIGPDAKITKSVIVSYATDKTYEGICYVKNNCKKFESEICYGTGDDDKRNSGFADIYGRNGKCTKGQIGTRNAELTGVLITGTMCAYNKIDMGNADNLYYNEVLTNTNEYENPAFSNNEFVIIENEVPSTIENKNPIEF